MALRATKELLDHERRITIEEFEGMNEFEEGYELIGGKLVKKPVPGFQHSNIADRIRIAYFKFDPDETIGVMRLEVLTRRVEDAPIPDLSFWLADRRPADDARIAVRPDLAIEVHVTGSLTKTTEKALKYFEAGVRLVWIIQPGPKVAGVLRPGMKEPQVIQADGTLDGEDVIPGFRLVLSDLFVVKG